MNRYIVVRFGIFILLFYLFSFILIRVLNIGIAEIQQFVLGFGFLAPVIYSIILFLGLTVPLNPISDFLIINLGVIAFPAYIAIIFTFFAHSGAITVNYLIGRKYGKKVLDKFVNKDNVKYVEKYTKRLTIKNLFLIRFVVPIATMFGADIISYIAGMQKLPFLKYYLASIIPWTILSIIYFTFSSYLMNISVFLYFLPPFLIVTIPLILLYIYKKRLARRNKEQI